MLPKRTAFAVFGLLWLAGCSGPQSALDPAGRGASDLAELFWWMAAGAAVVWTAVIALAVYAIRVHPDAGGRKAALFIIGGGAVVPTVVLTALLIYGLSIMPPLIAAAPPGTMQIAVTGEQWWWRVRYDPGSEQAVELANEIRLPAGAPVEFLLGSRDVIHSFWIPSLGGKMDMIPGRHTRLMLEPARTGTFRGACAEYCGTSHALMAFPVVVMEPNEFARWLEGQRAIARSPSSTHEETGRERFFATGCPACHSVAGTSARGVIGPDLSHVGSRLTLAAGTLPNEPGAFLRWIEQTESVKPGVHMPSFQMLERWELQALAAYLDSLQ